MEEKNNFEVTSKPKGSYITGIIGAVIGGSIATILWVLVYVELNYILSVLAMLIAFCSLKGYEICKGKMSKGVKPIITIISLVLVVIATLIVIPTLLANKNHSTIELLYSSTEFTNAIFRDLAISILFAVLGITASYPYINKKLIDHGIQVIDPEILAKQEEIKKIELNNKLKPQTKDEIKLIKSAFEKYNAFSKETATSKSNIISEMNDPKSEKIFKKFKSQNIILKNGNNYYYNTNNEFNLLKINIKSVFIITFIIIIICMIIGIGHVIFNPDSQNNNQNTSINSISTNLNTSHEYSIQNNSFTLDIPESWTEEESQYPFATYLYDKTDTASLSIFTTKKEDLENFSLETYANNFLKNYIFETYKAYNPEAISTVQKTKLGNYDTYTFSVNATSTINKLYIIGYWIETENYFIEFYGVTYQDEQNTYKPVFEKAISSFIEK